MKLQFRAWTGEYMAYQGEPDLETLQSFMFHYGDKELMLSSGLKDINGKLIYEGDIVELIESYDGESKYKSTLIVAFDSGSFVLYDHNHFRTNKDGNDFMCCLHESPGTIEVICNIYERKIQK